MIDLFESDERIIFIQTLSTDNGDDDLAEKLSSHSDKRVGFGENGGFAFGFAEPDILTKSGKRETFRSNAWWTAVRSARSRQGDCLASEREWGHLR